MVNKIKNFGYKKNYIYVFGIIVFSTLMIIPFIKIGQIGVHSDWSFHSARVQQLYMNLKCGHFFTYIGSDTFSKVGIANFIFYPTLFLYPWAILKLIFNPILAYLIYVWILFILTGLIAFFSMQSFDRRNSFQSFIFSLIYLISPYHLYLILTNYVLGEAIAYAFIPLVLLGIYNLLYKNKWLTLSVAMTIMAYVHYVSLFICIEVCTAITLCYVIQNRKVLKRHIVLLVKSVALSLALSAWQFVPLMSDFVGKDIQKPASALAFVQNLGDFISSAFSNDAYHDGGIGLLLIVTIFVGWNFINKNSQYMWIYILGVLFTLLITDVSPLLYFKRTPLALIQFPYRYTSYAIAFLAIILSKILVNLEFDNLNKMVVPIGIISIITSLYFGSVYNDLKRNANHQGDVSVLTKSRTGRYKTLRSKKDTPIIITDSTYNKQFSYGALYGETDYMPQRAFKHKKTVLNNIAFVDGKEEHMVPQTGPNVLKWMINGNKSTSVDLPALAYSHTVVYNNNKPIKFDVSSRGTVFVKLKKGSNHVVVTYKPSVFYFAFIVIELLGWIGLIVYSVKNKGSLFNYITE